MAVSDSSALMGVVLKAPEMIRRALFWILSRPTIAEGLFFHQASDPQVMVADTVEM